MKVLKTNIKTAAEVPQTSGLANVSPQTCDKSKMIFLEINICKSKTSLRMHEFSSIFQGVKKRVALRE